MPTTDTSARRLAITLTAYLVVLAVADLLPLDLGAPTTDDVAFITESGPSDWSITDVARWIGHLLMFVPAGIFLRGRRGGGRARLITDVVIAIAAATAAEMAQVFVMRGSSFSDVVINLAGIGLGYAIAPALARWWRGNRGRTATVVAAALLATGTLAMVAFPLGWSGWDPGFRLLLANEATGDRPWRGRLFDVAIYDRCLAAEEIDRVLDGTALPPTGAVARYEFEPLARMRSWDEGDEAPGPIVVVPDASAARLGSTLRVESGVLEPIAEGGVQIDAPALVGGDAPVAALRDRLVATKAMSLVVRFQAATVDVTGPARIVSLSADPYLRNFMLGQQDGDLVLRVRNRVAGPNGMRPSLQMESCVDPDRVQTAVALCTPSASRLIVDGERDERLVFIGLQRVSWEFFEQRVTARMTAGLLVAGLVLWSLVFGAMLTPRLGDGWRRDAAAVTVAALTLVVLVGAAVWWLSAG